MKKYFLLLVLTALSSFCFSQSQMVDSLKSLLTQNIHDTTRCNAYYGLIELEEDDKVWEVYNGKMKEIAEKNLKTAKQGTQLHTFYLKALASSYSNAGYLAKFRGDLPMALDYYHKGLAIVEKINDKKTTAGIMNNIGFLYNNTGQRDLGIQYLESTLAIFKELKDSTNIGMGYNNAGSLYSEKNNYDKALNYFFESARYLKRDKHQRTLAYTMNNIGQIYSKQADTTRNIKLKDSLYEVALKYYYDGLKLRENLKEKRGIAISLESVANLLVKQNKIQEAKQYAEKSYELSREIGYPDNLKRASEILGVIYAKTGSWKRAYEMQVLFKQMTDSINNESNRKASLQKSFQYAYEKKAAADSIRVEEERKVVQAELKQEKTKNVALYGGLALVGLFGAVMYNRFKVSQRQNALINTQKTELQKQKEIVENHQKETLDSIHYAKRIQTALIANTEFINAHVPDSFIYFNPKDIVSGDFYWAALHNNKFYLAVCDSTGHGVPGAFMSLLNIGFLAEAVKEKNIEQPHRIFNYVRERLISTISDEKQKDGMDGILLCFDKTTGKIEYSAANNAPVLVRNNEVIELPKDKMPVGKGEINKDFTLFSLDVVSGDILYIYTDGYADQFGGPKGKKYKYKQLNTLLCEISRLGTIEQKNKLESTFSQWKGALEQVDDVCVIGIKI